ncbi:MAG: hypothetical protein H6732_11835 [Alphaproteobacteria bacterium]|nr:hypothetical protein [Alphaproteobacteria bacterium]
MLIPCWLAAIALAEPGAADAPPASPEEGGEQVALAEPRYDRNGKLIVEGAAETFAARVARTARGRAAGEAFSLAADQATQRRFAMRQTFTSQMRDPNPFGSGDWKSTHTQTWGLVEWRELGGKVEYRETTCAVETEPVFGAETIYSAGFVKGVPVRFRTGKVDGATFAAGPYVQQFGVDLENPLLDPLPTSPDDPRLVDDDGDGLPGVTIGIRHPMVGEGRIWVGQRSVARLEGTVGEGGVIQGFIRTAPDMFKIDANRWWLKSESPQRPHPDPAQSPFAMVPVDASFGCAQLLQAKHTIFPALPALD